jgi:BCD family chlorophyll transporter-like MFS transporter
MTSTVAPLGWFSIFRLALVQTALGAIVVLTTSTMNRVMVVELALPAMLPGALVTLHHALQILRPRWGHGSDVGGHRTPWIIGGMAVLALGGTGAAGAIAVMADNTQLGVALAVVAFALVGIGVGATGTSLLALLATSVAPERRAPAATMVWMMMIAGFIVTTILAGSFLDPFTPMRLVAVTGSVSAIAFVAATLAIWGVEKRAPQLERAAQKASKPDFKNSLRQVWSESQARRFTIFIFVSMLAYSMQDLILEPYAGLVFGLTPGQSTKLAGTQNSGVFLGMLLVAIAANPRFGFGSLKAWTVAGCLGSAAALIALVSAASGADVLPLKAAVFALGFANGAYAVAAIGSMMGLASSGRSGREGMRMGIWGASQALAFGAGGFLGTVAVDVLRNLVATPFTAYALVFLAEAALFIVASALAVRAIVERGAAVDGGNSALPSSREPQVSQA